LGLQIGQEVERLGAALQTTFRLVEDGRINPTPRFAGFHVSPA